MVPVTVLIHTQLDIHGQCDQGLCADRAGRGFGCAEPAGFSSTQPTEVILALCNIQSQSRFKKTLRKVTMLHVSI